MTGAAFIRLPFGNGPATKRLQGTAKLVARDGTFTLIQASVEKGHVEQETHRQVFALVEQFKGPERIHVVTGIETNSRIIVVVMPICQRRGSWAGLTSRRHT